jgi:hypothetical protein
VFCEGENMPPNVEAGIYAGAANFVSGRGNEVGVRNADQWARLHDAELIEQARQRRNQGIALYAGEIAAA